MSLASRSPTTQNLVDAYYEAWIGTKSINTDVLEEILAPSMKYNGPIDALTTRDAFLVGLAEFASINAGVSFETRLYGESEAFTIYNARVAPLGEDIRIFERFAIKNGRIDQIDLVFDSIKLRPLIEAARAAHASPSDEPKRVVVRYRVKADQIGENTKAIERVFAELEEIGPSGLSYMSMSATDGTFVHVATIEGDNPLADLAAFKAFQAGLKQRADEPPKALDVRLVGSYSPR